MRNRFFTNVPLIAGTSIDLAGEELHHARVVRLREHEEIELFDGRGSAAMAVVEVLERDRVTVRVASPAASRESPLAVTLAMAIIHLEKFDLVLQKATELGAAAIIPMVTERVEVRPERYRGKRERWERIIFEAVKQSGRGRIPRIEDPAPFAGVVARPEPKIVFDADADPFPSPSSLTHCTILIGPEGGWSAEEIALARGRGCAFERLGPRRLRAETAAIVALAAVGARFGDL